MSTNAYAAKRAIIDRLKQLSAVPGNAMSGVQVLYAYRPAAAELVCVYGGAVVFDRDKDDAAVDGNSNRLEKETATVGVHIRVAMEPPDDSDGEPIEATDVRAEEIGEAIGEVLSAEPRLAGGSSVTSIAGGQGDYAPTDTRAVSRLSYRVTVESYIR